MNVSEDLEACRPLLEEWKEIMKILPPGATGAVVLYELLSSQTGQIESVKQICHQYLFESYTFVDKGKNK